MYRYVCKREGAIWVCRKPGLGEWKKGEKCEGQVLKGNMGTEDGGGLSN